MKVTVVEDKDKVKPIKYPILMQSQDDETVILFTGPCEGVRLTDNKGEPFVEISEEWYCAEGASDWQPFQGQIILEN